jgi:hypothetical protein
MKPHTFLFATLAIIGLLILPAVAATPANPPPVQVQVQKADASPLPLFTEAVFPDGQGIAFTPGLQTGQTVLVLRTAQGLQFFGVSPIGTPTPPPSPQLTGLAKDVRDWTVELVTPADGRAAEAKRLAAGYRRVADRATAGEFKTVIEVQTAQTTENRAALGLPANDPEAGKKSRWYPLILRLAEYLQSQAITDPQAMGPTSLQIAQGLEASP